MTLFAFIDSLFSKNGPWYDISDKTKYEFSYMTFHFLSIKYPEQINKMQLIGLKEEKTARILDSWHEFLTSKYTRTPNWIRTKSGTKEKNADLLKSIKKLHIHAWMTEMMLGTKDFDDLMKFRPTETVTQIKQYVSSLNLN